MIYPHAPSYKYKFGVTHLWKGAAFIYIQQVWSEQNAPAETQTGHLFLNSNLTLPVKM